MKRVLITDENDKDFSYLGELKAKAVLEKLS
jgi:hypothetical protein